MRLIIPILIAICFIACEEADEPMIYNDKLIGYWNNAAYNDSILEYSRTTCLDENEFGIYFLEDGTLYERKNAGWCGTPPISCIDYKGTWTQNDSIIDITVGYWGGQETYNWQLILLDNQLLKVKVMQRNVLE